MRSALLAIAFSLPISAPALSLFDDAPAGPALTPRPFGPELHRCGGGSIDAEGRRAVIGGVLFDLERKEPLGEISGGRLSDDGTRCLHVSTGKISTFQLQRFGEVPIAHRVEAGEEWIDTAWAQDQDRLFVVVERTDKKQAEKNEKKRRSGRKPQEPLPPVETYSLECWDLAKAERVDSTELERRPTHLLLTPDEKSIVVIDGERGLEFPTTKLRRPEEHPALATAKGLLTFLDDGRLFAGDGPSKNQGYDLAKKQWSPGPTFIKGMLDIRVVEGIVTGRTKFGVLTFPAGKSDDVKTFSPSSAAPARIGGGTEAIRYIDRLARYLFIDEGGTVTSFDPVRREFEILLELACHRGKVTSIVSDSERVYTTDVEGLVLAREHETGALIWRVETHSKGCGVPLVVPGGLIWSIRPPDARRDRNATPHLVVQDPARGGEIVHEQITGLPAIERSARSSDGGVVALIGADGYEVYDGKTFELRFRGRAERLVNVAVDPAGSRVFLLLRNSMRIVDAASGELLGTADGKFGNEDLHIDADGRRMLTSERATGRYAGVEVFGMVTPITEWDLADYKPTRTIEVKSAGRFVVSPRDDRILVTGWYRSKMSADHDVSILDRETLDPVWVSDGRTILSHDSFERAAHWSQDGERIYLVPRDAWTVTVLDLPVQLRSP